MNSLSNTSKAQRSFCHSHILTAFQGWSKVHHQGFMLLDAADLITPISYFTPLSSSHSNTRLMFIPIFCLMQILFVTLSTRCSADLISLPPPAGEQSTGALLLLAASCQLSSPAFTTSAAAPSRRGISSSGWQDKQALASQLLLELCQVQDGMG